MARCNPCRAWPRREGFRAGIFAAAPACRTSSARWPGSHAPIRGASPRSIVSMKAICSSGERAWPPNSFGQPRPIHPVLPISSAKSASNSRLENGLSSNAALRVSRPVLLEPSLHLLAQRVAGRTEIVLRQRRAAIGPAGTRPAGAAPRGAPPSAIVSRCTRLKCRGGLVLLGIADGAECMLGFERNAPQRVAGEGNRAIGKIAPVAVARDHAGCAA